MCVPRRLGDISEWSNLESTFGEFLKSINFAVNKLIKNESCYRSVSFGEFWQCFQGSRPIPSEDMLNSTLYLKGST